MASVPLPGAPAVFRGVSCSWLPLSGSATYLAPVSWPTPAVDVWCWVGGVLVHHLVFYLVPAQLTLSGFCNLSGSSLLAYSCGGALLLGWRCLVRRLVLYLVPCYSSGACSLRRFPWGFSAFSVTGCLSFCCPGGVGWAATLPFSFSVLLLLADRGSLGPAPCIRVLQLGLCLLFRRQCNHPACFPFP